MQQYDAVVVGAGPAGLSAALVLGRARRNVLVLDSGEPRNAAARRAHGFFTRDHTRPSELLAMGREQIKHYPNVRFETDEVLTVEAMDGGFEVRTAIGHTIAARSLFLATGVQDELPAISGLPENWGSRVHHCPYCDGWEHRDQPLAVIGEGKMGAAYAAELSGWSAHITLCTNGPAELSDFQRQALAHHNIPVIEAEIAAFEDDGEGLATLRFVDGQRIEVDALFLSPRQHQRVHPLAEQLALDTDEDGKLAIGPYGQTSLARCFVIGDAARKIQQIAYAVGMGTAAAIALNQDLLQTDFFTEAREAVRG